MYIVTGGAGFIGSNVVAALCAREAAEVTVCDRLGSGEKWRNLAKAAVGDIIPPEALFDYLTRHRDRLTAVIHMGAISATTELDVDALVENNLALSLRLFRWCADHGVRLIYASSAATYGNGRAGFDDDGSPASLASLRPLNAYGWSKVMVDRAIARHLANGSPPPPQWVGLKFFNVYGPNEYHKGSQASVVSQVFPHAKAKAAFNLFRSHHPDYADGGQLRDFIWIDDAVAVILWLLDTPSVSGLFNLGSGKARSFLDLANAVYHSLGHEPKIRFIDTPVALREHYQYFTEARMDRLREAGYAGHFTPLEDGVRQYVQSYLNHAHDPYR